MGELLKYLREKIDDLKYDLNKANYNKSEKDFDRERYGRKCLELSIYEKIYEKAVNMFISSVIINVGNPYYSYFYKKDLNREIKYEKRD